MELCPEFIRDPGDFSLCSTRHDEYQHEWGRRLSISPTEPGHYTVFALVYELDGNQAIGWENAHLAVVGEDVSYEWPVPALEAPSTVEVGEAVTLDASDSEPIGGAQNSRLSAYEFSGDVEHEGESPIHTVTFDEPGTKEVSLRVEGTLDPMEGGLRTPVVGWSRETATVTIEVEDLDTSWWDPYTDDDHVVPDSDHSDAAIQDYHAGEISLDQVLMIIDSYETGDPVADAQWWQPYTNDDGTVDTDGLRRALDDWRADELTTERQRIIIDHWRSGEPIDA
ncbi:PKD domain-containing protein [Natronobiforma cellulositropha]|uniref:PKD domain-containing protein n=1 Tax=Natronobiforma cellulositropha TaxID=1679076 RepID=UPI0021D59B91|nr:PKD domain-containing protein [Natronobiforma cellulositropha]